MIADLDPIAGVRGRHPSVPKPLDPNNARERMALIHAKQFLGLNPRDLQQAIAYLLCTNKENDIDQVAMRARIASLES